MSAGGAMRPMIPHVYVQGVLRPLYGAERERYFYFSYTLALSLQEPEDNPGWDKRMNKKSAVASQDAPTDSVA